MKLLAHHYKILECIYAREVEAALSGSFLRVCQLKSKWIPGLLEEGYIEEEEYKLKGILPVTVRGYVLTHRGSIAYCEYASKRMNGGAREQKLP